MTISWNGSVVHFQLPKYVYEQIPKFYCWIFEDGPVKQIKNDYNELRLNEMV